MGCSRSQRTSLWLAALAFVLGAVFVEAGIVGAAPPPGRGGGAEAVCPVAGPVDVVLDPGHGGSDPGAQHHGLVEKEQNLLVAQDAAAILVGQGISVALTRDDNDTTLGNSERGEIANVCGAQLFVSIHFNASTNPEVNYTQTFWGKRRKDEAFSWVMHDALWPALATYGGQPTTLTDGGVGQFATGSLLQAEMPGTLVESVFLSNPEEAGRLTDETGARQEQIAAAIASGVVTWLSAT